MAFGNGQRRTEGRLEVQLLSGALGGVWQGLEQLEPLRQVGDRFHERRALARALARPLPVGDSLRDQARLGVVMRQRAQAGSLWSPEIAPPTPGQCGGGTDAECV